MKWIAAGIITALVFAFGVSISGAQGRQPKIQIEVTDIDTGQAIQRNQTVVAGDRFRVTIQGNGVDCAGQFVVTALGASPAPPAALVQSAPSILGSVGNDSITGAVLTANALGIGQANDWKVSASCNGSFPHHFSTDSFEFFAL